MATQPLLPSFRLPDATGGRFGTEDLLQRRDILLALVHEPRCEPCRRLLEALSTVQAPLLDREASVVGVIMGAGSPGAPLPFPTLLDADGATSGELAWRLGMPAGEARLIVADRWGAVYATLGIHGVNPASVAAEAIDWLDFIERQCPECGVPEWS